MDWAQELRRLLIYDDWANREALTALQAAGQPPARAVRIFAHILGAECLWMDRMGAAPGGVPVWPEWDLALCEKQLGELRATRAAVDKDLAVEELKREVNYTNSKGQRWTNTVGDILMHVAMHSAYHRGQIAMLLGGAGKAAAYTDFIEGVRLGLVV